MKHMSYGDRLIFKAEYWRYLCAEKCNCTVAAHEGCHERMMDALDGLDDFIVKEFQQKRIVERMREFIAFTQDPRLQHYARTVIERINFITNHRMDCGDPLPVPAEKSKKAKIVRGAMNDLRVVAG